MPSASWPSQNLRNLERTGALRHEAASAAEIHRLFDLARSSLSSAGLKSNALEMRYQVATAAKGVQKAVHAWITRHRPELL